MTDPQIAWIFAQAELDIPADERERLKEEQTVLGRYEQKKAEMEARYGK